MERFPGALPQGDSPVTVAPDSVLRAFPASSLGKDPDAGKDAFCSPWRHTVRQNLATEEKIKKGEFM